MQRSIADSGPAYIGMCTKARRIAPQALPATLRMTAMGRGAAPQKMAISENSCRTATLHEKPPGARLDPYWRTQAARFEPANDMHVASSIFRYHEQRSHRLLQIGKIIHRRDESHTPIDGKKTWTATLRKPTISFQGSCGALDRVASENRAAASPITDSFCSTALCYRSSRKNLDSSHPCSQFPHSMGLAKAGKHSRGNGNLGRHDNYSDGNATELTSEPAMPVAP